LGRSAARRSRHVIGRPENLLQHFDARVDQERQGENSWLSAVHESALADAGGSQHEIARALPPSGPNTPVG
jgi:hypothetical protein